MKPFPFTFVLAPMAELSTIALRTMAKDFCPDILTYSEMLSAAAVAQHSVYNEAFMKKHPHDDPIVYQILGNSPEIMAEGCSILSDKGCYAVDINMGCSAPDILKKQQGAYLLNDIKLAERIVSACRKTSSTRLSVKIRTGFTEYNEKETLHFVKMLQDCGVDFISVHPRFAKLGFRRTADWALTSKISEALTIPVIGNGDITSPHLALRRRNESGCAAVMIGREAVKSPWIFRLCSDLLEKNDNLLEINCEYVFTTILERIQKFLPVELHKSRGHRLCFYFCKNVIFGHKLFSKIRSVSTIDEMISLIKEYYERNPHERILEFCCGEKIQKIAACKGAC